MWIGRCLSRTSPQRSACANLTPWRLDTINLSLNFDYIPDRAWRAVLRVAYLVMFRALGYQYILSSPAGVIRDLIIHFEHVTPSCLDQIVGETGDMSTRPDRPLTFLLVNRTAVMVIMTFVTDTKRHYATFLPAIPESEEKVFHTLVEVAHTVWTNQATFSTIRGLESPFQPPGA
jgi:hypothetical protein